LTVRNRRLQGLSPYGSSYLDVLWSIAAAHGTRSKLYKPEISFCLPLEKIISKSERKKFIEKVKKTKKD